MEVAGRGERRQEDHLQVGAQPHRPHHLRHHQESVLGDLDQAQPGPHDQRAGHFAGGNVEQLTDHRVELRVFGALGPRNGDQRSSVELEGEQLRSEERDSDTSVSLVTEILDLCVLVLVLPGRLAHLPVVPVLADHQAPVEVADRQLGRETLMVGLHPPPVTDKPRAGAEVTNLAEETAVHSMTDPPSEPDLGGQERLHPAHLSPAAGPASRGLLDTVNAGHFSDEDITPVSSHVTVLSLGTDEVLGVGRRDVEEALGSEEPAAVDVGGRDWSVVVMTLD